MTYNPFDHPINKETLDKLFVIIYEKLEFDDKRFLQLMFNMPISHRGVLEVLLMAQAANTIDLLLDQPVESTFLNEVLQVLYNDLDLTLHSRDDLVYNANVAMTNLEKLQ